MPNAHSIAPPARPRQGLPRLDQVVLELCSIIYEPVEVSTLIRCLYRSGIDFGVNRPDLAREIQPCLERLQSDGLLNSRLECDRALVETISRRAVAGRRFKPLASAVLAELPAPTEAILANKVTHPRAVRNLRIAIHTADLEKFHQFLISYERVLGSGPHPIIDICNQPFDPQWFATLPDHIQFLALHEILKASLRELAPIGGHLDYLEHGPPAASGPPPIQRHDSFLYLLISGRLLQGELEPAKRLIDAHQDRLATYGFKGWWHGIRGDYRQAVAAFEDDLAKLRTLNLNEQAFFTGFEGLVCLVCLLNTGQGYDRLGRILSGIRALQAGAIHQFAYQILDAVVKARESKSDLLTILGPRPNPLSSLDSLFLALADYWVEGRLEAGLQPELERHFALAQANGYHWLAQEYAELLFLATHEPAYREVGDRFQAETGVIPMLKAIHHEEPWRKAIKELKELATPEGAPASQERVIWQLGTDSQGLVTGLVPLVQQLGENGRWRKGRRLSLKKLANQELPFLNEDDRRLALALRMETDTVNGVTYAFDLEQALLAAVGHPRVFLAGHQQNLPVEIVKRAPELYVQQTGQSARISLLPFPAPHRQVAARLESASRLAVCQISPTIRRIAEILSPHGLYVPLEHQDEVLSMLGAMSAQLTVHSDFSGQEEGGRIKTIEADQTIYCHLLPASGGLHLSLLVKPFAELGQYLTPGQGSAMIIAGLAGQATQVCRDLKSEEQRAQAVVEACPSLRGRELDNWEWLASEAPDCLQILHELQALRGQVVVEWPKGELFRLREPVSSPRLYLQVRQRRNWFELDGQLRIDEETAIGMGELLELIRRGQGRFLPLSDGQFLALSQALYQQLEQLGGLTWSDRERLQFSPLAAPLVRELTQGAERLDSDRPWQELSERVAMADHRSPAIPVTLRAELRPYQAEGFRWLSRLAYLGFGACLADEMGLGKTIQTLALLLEQAPLGPALIVAPTSVCFNWQDEAARFAPTLKVQMFGGPERSKALRRLSGFDVLIASYGLLQQEQELFSQKQWRVVVLDEAQAIKNMATKRSRAAMSLKAHFKLTTTGTPLENNLGELWNLFQFVNPGLLGTINQFNRRFAGPIERDKDLDCQRRLRRLIAPFILRRLKSQVLDELPPRTEINLQVTLSEEEAVFYESLRRQAIQRLESSGERDGNRPLRILAEIMRLRRACCHPDLVAPGAGIESAKLAVFAETIDELLANRHKVLVFSQFVDHLAIIKNFLDERGLSYQYLDGATPPRQRKLRVEAFQAGQGDLFLISLKAGGLGLNLTAANYVIHLDPWWNPAVEDQASDRAHRIGQKLPVTIYRLITKGTIEEKIVALHRDKRDLAENLLKGTEVGGQVSADELLRLLRAD